MSRQGALLGALLAGVLPCLGGCSSAVCGSALDCPTGLACVAGACVATTATGCLGTSDCPPGDLCRDGTCQPDCALQGCPTGEACDATSHRCVAYVAALTSGGSTGGSGTAGGTGGGSTGGATGGTSGGTTAGTTGGSSGGTTGGKVDAGCPTSDTWNGYAQSFFASNCGCHAVNEPVITRHHFSDYPSVMSWGYLMIYAISYGSMPPPDGGAPLDPTDKTRILRWLQCGMPE